MFFLLAIFSIAPPVISVILYERLRGEKLRNTMRIAMYIIFTFFITIIWVTALLFLGWDYQTWLPNEYGGVSGLAYMLLYAGVSLISAIALPHIICLIKAKAVEEVAENNLDENTADAPNLGGNEE